MARMPGLGMPVLGVLGLEPDTMGWGTEPDDVLRYLPPGGRFVPLEGVGHFVHIEQPQLVASLVLDFLGDLPAAPAGGWAAETAASRPAPRTDQAAEPLTTTTFVEHGRSRLALHEIRPASDPSVQPLLLLHGLGERTPATVPTVAADWPGPVCGLDFTGHGGSTIPAGGGYSAELLMADVDAALRHLGPATLAGRGLGAYIALLATGARPGGVRGTVLLDGPGMQSRSTGPGDPAPPNADTSALAPPDPFALVELARDIRTPDYAAIFVRMALLSSTTPAPVTVSCVLRPPWLEAVVDEPGVVCEPAADALERYAKGS